MKASKYHNQDPVYYRYREFFVGVFALIPLVLIPVILVTMLVRSDLAKEKFDLYFTHKLNAQITAGDEVYILSKKVGFVRHVELNTRGYIVVRLAIEEQYRPIIHDDTQIRLRQKNVIMGDWQMELIQGDGGGQMVEAGDTLELIPPVDLAKISRDVISITELVDGILDTVANGNGIITRVLNSDTLINREIGVTTKSIQRALTTLNEVLDQGSELVSSGTTLIDSVIAVRTPALFDGVESIVSQTDSMLTTIDYLLNEVDSLPAEIYRTLELVNKDLLEAEILLKATQKHWILRKEVEEVKEEL